MKYTTVIGLEIHAEMLTKSKVFCGCDASFGGEENTRVCPRCSGMPGTLPVLNEKVLEYGAKVTGATVHFVDEGTDTGPIILQKAVSVLDDDTPEILQQRVLRVEHELLPLAVAHLVEGRIRVEGRKVTMERMTD